MTIICDVLLHHSADFTSRNRHMPVQTATSDNRYDNWWYGRRLI